MCDNSSVSGMPSSSRLGGQQGGGGTHGYRNSTADNWRRRFPASQPRVAHIQRQNVQNIDPRPPRRIPDPKPRFLPSRTVQHSRPPLRNRSNNDFCPSFNPPPRFLRLTGPVHVVPYAAVPALISTIPPVIDNIPASVSTLENSSPGLSNHSSQCSEDVDIPNITDPEVRGLVDAFLKMLEFDGGLERGLNLLLSQDMSNSRAAFRLALAIALILHTQESKANPPRLREYIRITVLFKFVEHWKPGGHWEIEATMPVTRPFTGIARKGMSIASFITSLFIARVVSAGDFQDCLDFLIAHPVHFDRLCAMHAMVTQANFRLCKVKYWLRTKAFRDRLAARNLQNPAFVWAQDGPSSFFVMDIIATLDRWHCTAVMNDVRRASVKI